VQVSEAGGNAIRYWVFGGGEHTPAFDHDGYVNWGDGTDAMIEDVRSVAAAWEAVMRQSADFA
jgi:hypothetical protein